MDAQNRGRLCWELSAVFAVGLALPLAGSAGSLPPATAQVVVVTTPGWSAVDGTLQLYERERTPDGAAWRRVGAAVPVVVGKAGMGWGRGAVAMPERPGDPVKREGDHRSPAGAFPLGEAFGYAEAPPAAWRVRYRMLRAATECVDDPQSRHYNRILDRPQAGGPVASGPTATSLDWTSSEKMRDAGEAYRWGLVVEQNDAPPEPGRGSCVFLHVWSGAGEGTEGCTAMPEDALTRLLGQLVARRHPMLVEMPAAQYRMVAARLGLPSPPRRPDSSR
jgi:D-alanyl-D-alanine dipeptidase